MKKTTKIKDQYELRKFLGSIPADDVNRVSNELIALVKSNRVIFRNWRLGLTRVPILERSLMNDYAVKHFGRVIFSTDNNEQQRTETNNRSTEVR